MSKDYSAAERFLMGLFGWPGVKLPAAEVLPIPRDRRHRTVGTPIAPHPLNGVEILSPKRNLGRVPSNGFSSGMAINKAHPSDRRSARIGREGYTQRDADGNQIMVRDPVRSDLLGREIEMPMPEQVLQELPISEGQWSQYGGWPGFANHDDRSACWIGPDGTIWAVWRYTANRDWVVVLHPELKQYVNDAATWGKFNSRGELIAGTGGSTANGDPWVCTTITPDLIGGPPVLLSGFIGLYAQHKRDGTLGDGLLEEPDDDYGIKCGDVQIWKENSQLIRRLTSMGPVNEWIAESLVTCGFLVNDQAGSKKPINRDSYGKIPREQLDPKAPAMRFQAVRDWDTRELRDARDFQFSLEEAHLAVEQHVEFRLPGDPHTPFHVAPEPDPRIARIEVAHGQFDEVIHELGLDNGNTKYLVVMNDQTMSEALRLINK